MARADVTILPGLDEILYAAKGGSSTTSDLYRVNPLTGACTSVGPIGFAMTGMDFHPVSNVLYGVTSNNSALNNRSLITINTTTGDGTLVAQLNIAGSGNRTVADIAFHSNGTLYGWYTNTSDLVSINLSNAALTVIGNSGLGSFGCAMSFDANNTLWLLPDGEGEGAGLYTVDIASGNGTYIIDALGDGNFNAFNAGAFSPENEFHIIYNDGVLNPLNRINTTTGIVTEIGDTLATIDALAWQF